MAGKKVPIAAPDILRSALFCMESCRCLLLDIVCASWADKRHHWYEKKKLPCPRGSVTVPIVKSISFKYHMLVSCWKHRFTPRDIWFLSAVYWMTCITICKLPIVTFRRIQHIITHWRSRHLFGIRFRVNMLWDIFILIYLLKTKYWGEWTFPWSLSSWRCRVT